MKACPFLLIFFSLLLSEAVRPQETQKPVSLQPNLIKSGFYIKLGPVLPVGLFATQQVFIDPPPNQAWMVFPPARVGGTLDMGYLIYLGGAVANNRLRFGIDAGFLSAWFNTAKPDSLLTGKKEAEFWYYFIGQKFGPLITVNPVDRLMIDLSYKLNANVSWHDSDWGYKLTGQELMMNIRYRVILLSLIYNFGKINYNDFDGSRPVHNADISTFRILMGFKL